MTRRGAVGILALALCAAFCMTQLSEVDFFWHLLAGQRILATGAVPRDDAFTWTSAGRPWVDLHWGFQVAAAAIHRRFGWSGLELLKIGLVVSGFALALLAAWLRRPTLAGPLLLIPGVVAAQERFTLRPEAASFFFFGALLLVLSTRSRRPRLVLWSPLIVAMWANVHALYAVGIGALLLTAAGEFMDGRRARQRRASGAARDLAGRDDARRRERRHLLTAALVAIPASLLTPYGPAGWSLSLRLLLERVATANLYGRQIAEFQAPFSGFGPTAAVWAFAAFSAAVVIAMLLGRRACGTADLLLVAVFLGLALLARRNIPLFVLAALPAAAPAAAAAWDRGAAALQRRGGAAARLGRGLPLAAGLAGCAAVVVLLGDVVSNRFFARDGTQRYFGQGPAPGFYPEESAGFVATNRLPDRVLNDMTMGGYLAWRWFPDRRTFIDGRLEVHDPALFAAYLDLQAYPRRFEAEARAGGISTVVWSHRHALDAAPLIRHLASGQGWRLVHVDLAAAVFVRDRAGMPASTEDADLGAPAERLLREASASEAGTRAADPVPRWSRRLLPRVEVPAAEVGCGIFFALIGRPETALPILQDAVRRAPWSAVLRYDLGLVLTQSGRQDEARAAFEEAVRRDPRMAAAGAALALLRLRAGDEPGALQGWARAEAAGRLPAAAHRERGALLARRGRLDEAIEDYRRALADEPGQGAWRAELALLYAGRGMLEPARAEIDRAQALDPTACLPRVAAARLRRAGGDRDGALEAARRVVASDPACPEARAALAGLLAEAGLAEEAAREVSEALRLGLDPASLASDPALRPLVPAR